MHKYAHSLITIIDFPGVQAKLAQMAAYGYIIRATKQLTLTAVDEGLKPAVASAIAKYHCTELTRTIINHAMDIHGGKAIMLGRHNYLAASYQGIPISITVEVRIYSHVI